MIENRQKTRVSCQGTVTLERKGGNVEATVLDLSQTGLRIRSQAKLTVGSLVSLRLPDRALGGKTLKAVVRWVRLGETYEAGLELVYPDRKLSRRWLSRLCPEIHSEGYGLQRRSEVRASVSLPIALGDFTEGRLMDLSRSGARFEVPSQIDGPTELYLCLPRTLVAVQADIVRAQSNAETWVYSVKFHPQNDDQSETLGAFIHAQCQG